MHPDQACCRLVQYLRRAPTPKVEAALYRIKDALSLHMTPEEWYPDLILKAFDDLDLAFFGHKLAGRTRAKWAPHSKFEAIGAPGALGATRGREAPFEPIQIYLNAHEVFSFGSAGHFRQMWATVSTYHARDLLIYTYTR